MILNFDDFCINEKHSIKKVKKLLRGVLNSADRDTMRKELRHNIIVFKFIKRDGSLRKAKGTLHPSYLPPLKGGSPKPEHQMVYYDLEKEHWRSFRSYSFIKILNVKSEEDYIGKKKLHKIKEKEKEKEEEEKIEKSEKEESEKSTEEETEEDIKKKEYKVGDKIPEKELMRRSTDFRHGSKKNKFTKKSNDAHKKGELDKDDEENED